MQSIELIAAILRPTSSSNQNGNRMDGHGHAVRDNNEFLKKKLRFDSQ